MLPENILSGISIFGVEGNIQANNVYYTRGGKGTFNIFTMPFIPTNVMMCTGNYFMGTGRGIISAFKLANGASGGVGVRISSSEKTLDNVYTSWDINSTNPQNVSVRVTAQANAGGSGYYGWYSEPFVVFWN